MIDRTTIIRWSSFTAYFLAVFLLFLVLLFPYDRVKYRLEQEVRKNTSLELTIARISPRFLNRFVLTDVVLSDKDGRVMFESPSVSTQVSLFGILRGLVSVKLDSKAYGGKLAVKSEQGAKRSFLAVDASDLDISSYTLLKTLGIKLAGKTGGTIELTDTTGRAKLWFKNLASRELKVMGFPVPDLDFEQGWIEGDLKDKRLTLKRVELDGRELKVRITGDVMLQQQGALNLVVKLKPSERLAHEQAGLLSLIKNRDPEGFYQFSLGGTLAAPLPRL